MIQVGRLLDEPPGVFLAAAVVVVAVADPVEPGGVDRVPPHVLERAVVAAVLRDLGVAVEVAAEQAVGLAAGLDPVVAHPRDVLRLVGMDGRLARRSSAGSGAIRDRIDLPRRRGASAATSKSLLITPGGVPDG